MTLYRIDWEDTVDDHFGYKLIHTYEYIAGNARLGKAVRKGVNSGKQPLEIHHLYWSPHVLLACLRGIESDEPNAATTR